MRLKNPLKHTVASSGRAPVLRRSRDYFLFLFTTNLFSLATLSEHVHKDKKNNSLR